MNLGTLRVGCPMWANRAWVGRYLPRGTKAAEMLRAYARVCTAVEGNTTFYASPKPENVLKWRDQTDADFRFVFKLPRTLTHRHRLAGVAEKAHDFCRRIEPLGERLGPISIQLPPSFGPSRLGVLEQFLAEAPPTFSWAVEVRDAAFCDGGPHERQLNDMLHAAGADRIIVDTRALFAGPADTPEEKEAFERKPRLEVRPVALGQHPIVRFIGQTNPDANPPFWKPWIETVTRWLRDGRSPVVFLHTPDNLVAPAQARRFYAAVAAELPELPPLPEPPPMEDATLW